MDKWLHTIAILWSKMAFFKRVWHIVEVLPHPWPSQGHWSLIRPLKWGIQCLPTPSGSKHAGHQSFKKFDVVLWFLTMHCGWWRKAWVMVINLEFQHESYFSHIYSWGLHGLMETFSTLKLRLWVRIPLQASFFLLKSQFLCKIRSNPVQKITNCAFLLSFAK